MHAENHILPVDDGGEHLSKKACVHLFLFAWYESSTHQHERVPLLAATVGVPPPAKSCTRSIGDDKRNMHTVMNKDAILWRFLRLTIICLQEYSGMSRFVRRWFFQKEGKTCLRKGLILRGDLCECEMLVQKRRLKLCPMVQG